LRVPDRRGNIEDVALGYDSLDGYLHDTSYFGGSIGRYANRIGGGEFTLNGTTYKLEKNDNGNHLHGGVRGFDKVLWTAKDVSASDTAALQFTYLSKDGDGGYPGNLTAKVTYTLTDKNELKIDYEAKSDKDTIINLTNHTYFNLAGQGSGDILQHQLQLHAGRFTPIDRTLIPTGEIRSVKGTPFDFSVPTAIGARISQNDEQLKFGLGYDHNFVLDSGGSQSPALAGSVYEPVSGRVLEVWTTEPGIQFYSGNMLKGASEGKAGNRYPQRSGFCLETQHFPDSPNKPNFPTTVLKAGAEFRSTTVYRFSAK
jgi:aldose 1-epimerase